MGRGAVLLGALTLAAASSAHAQAPITNREYAIDIYEGVAIGNTAWVGMGGAGAALITGTAGTLINPSAPAVRETTDNARWDWDYHFDVLSARASLDYDNNGVQVGDGGTRLSDRSKLLGEEDTSDQLRERLSLIKTFLEQPEWTFSRTSDFFLKDLISILI